MQRATALGWSQAELGKRSNLSRETLYKLRVGQRKVGPKVIEGFLRAFPNLSYRDLFVPAERSVVHPPSSAVIEEAA